MMYLCKMIVLLLSINALGMEMGAPPPPKKSTKARSLSQHRKTTLEHRQPIVYKNDPEHFQSQLDEINERLEHILNCLKDQNAADDDMLEISDNDKDSYYCCRLKNIFKKFWKKDSCCNEIDDDFPKSNRNSEKNACNDFADCTVRFNGVKDCSWFVVKLTVGSAIIIFVGYKAYLIYQDVYAVGAPVVNVIELIIDWCGNVVKELEAKGVDTKVLFNNLSNGLKNGTVSLIEIINKNNKTVIDAMETMPVEMGNNFLSYLSFLKQYNISMSNITNDALGYLVQISDALYANRINMFKFIDDLAKTSNDIGTVIGKIGNIQTYIVPTYNVVNTISNAISNICRSLGLAC